MTYSKLLYAAEVCERYKAQYGVWPTNFVQLSEGRPEFGDPRTRMHGDANLCSSLSALCVNMVRY